MKSLRFTVFFTVFFIVVLYCLSFSPQISANSYEFDIQAEIDNADDGDVIIVPDGSYKQSINFLGKAITVKSQNGPDKCSLDGILNEPLSGVTFNNGEGRDSILEGFTIANFTSGNGCGGGIYCGENTSPTIINCKIKDNKADGGYDALFGSAYGGGIYCGRYSSPKILNCEIENNYALGANGAATGGGIFFDRFSEAEVISCDISNNHSKGAMYRYGYGGGVGGYYAKPKIFSCLIENNIAVHENGLGGHGVGGGAYFAFCGETLIFKSCLIINNRASSSGGGIALRFSGGTIIDGCTFYGNNDTHKGGAIYIYNAKLVIRNSIFWNNLPHEICAHDDLSLTYLDIDYSDIKGGIEEIIIEGVFPGFPVLIYGEGNIDMDPVFKNAEEGDFHLNFGSPCIDAGDPLFNISEWDYDIDHQERKIDILWITCQDRGPVDMGADEFTRKDDLIGNWEGIGVWHRNSDSGEWSQFNTNDAVMLTAGDLDGDNIEDLVGWWDTPNGVWVKYGTGTWERLVSSDYLTWIAVGDINGDGKDDFVGSWQQDSEAHGIWLRDSETGVWTRLLATEAKQITMGDINNDGKDDLVGLWPSLGMWIRYGQDDWVKVAHDLPDMIVCGDMNGDGYSDIVSSHKFLVFYIDVKNQYCVPLTNSPADKIATGDLDGDYIDDLLLTWKNTPNTTYYPGLWVKYSSTGSFVKLHNIAPTFFAAGKLR